MLPTTHCLSFTGTITWNPEIRSLCTLSSIDAVLRHSRKWYIGRYVTPPRLIRIDSQLILTIPGRLNYLPDFIENKSYNSSMKLSERQKNCCDFLTSNQISISMDWSYNYIFIVTGWMMDKNSMAGPGTGHGESHSNGSILEVPRAHYKMVPAVHIPNTLDPYYFLSTPRYLVTIRTMFQDTKREIPVSPRIPAWFR